MVEITDEFLADLETKARAAEDAAVMAGPWTREWNNRDDHDAGIDIIGADGERVALVEHLEAEDGDPLTNDACRVADHIAAANPAAVLALVAEIRRLRAENEKLRAERDKALAFKQIVAFATEEFREWVHAEADEIEGQEHEVALDHNRMLDALQRLSKEADRG